MVKPTAGACVLASFLVLARGAFACQDPPRVPCDLIPAAATVPEGVPFDVIFSMTNLWVDPTTGFPGQAMDDLDYSITVTVEKGFAQRPTGSGCLPTGELVPSMIEPAAALIVQLDDAWSPAAEEPTGLRQVFRITPSVAWPAYVITVTAVTLDDTLRGCTVSTCVAVMASGDPPLPTAEFVGPVMAGDGGALLPFDLLVHRNGYEPTHPLRVVVTPSNESDPIDIFPIDPPDLTDASRGMIVTQEDELVHFTCHCHFPCFVGASNVYEVSLIDTVTTARVWNRTFVGKSLVDRAPLALVEKVEIIDANGDGVIEACEGAQVHVRLIGRHPFANAPMTDMHMDLPLPAGVTVANWSLHFHDNPMDLVDPLPAELVATGIVTPGPTNFIVDTSRVAHRYETISSHPPVFKDMVEAELLLDIAPGALAAPGSLDFAGFTVSGVVTGIPRLETAPTVSIPIVPGPPPPEASSPSLQPLRIAPDKQTITWDGSSAALFNVYRGDIGALPRYGDCVRASVSGSSVTDADPFPRDGAWFYLIAGTLCGSEGSLGSDSAGAERVPATRCP